MTRHVGTSNRAGVAFFMLVLSVLIVITAATGLLIRGEWSVRRGQRDQTREETLAAAIELAKSVSAESMTLPIDNSGDERIDVSMNKESQRYTAQWLRGEQQVAALTRDVKPEQEKEQNE